jgi:hypothetical protein
VSFSISHADGRDPKRQDLVMLQGVGGEESAREHGREACSLAGLWNFSMKEVRVGEERRVFCFFSRQWNAVLEWYSYSSFTVGHPAPL